MVCESSGSLYRDAVDFVVVCSEDHIAKDDPIVLPGAENIGKFWHMHQFAGNTTTNAASTVSTLLAGTSNCGVSKDKSAYWTPTLHLANGTRVVPYTVREYYRVGTNDGASVHPFPLGLKMLAGDPMATGPQKTNVAAFYCRTPGGGPQTPKQATPPQCSTTQILASSVIFPNCWNGKDLDSPDHRSHVAYAGAGETCPPGWVHIPQITQEERYNVLPAPQMEGMYNDSMNSPYTLHADFFNAWDPATLQYLVKNCMNASVRCGDISDKRMPPPAG